MTPPFEREGYGYLKIDHPVKVDYTFVRNDTNMGPPQTGQSRFFGKQSFILEAEIPKLNMVQELLTHKIKLKVLLRLHNENLPIRALTRTSWIETIDPASYKCKIGLTFEDITPKSKELLYKFVIKEQMK